MAEVEVSKEVKNAAKLLDKVIPGWHNRVNVDTLSMGDCGMCMLGQTFGISAEMGIAKELYPKEWATAARVISSNVYNIGEGDGYAIGLEFFKRWGKQKAGAGDKDALRYLDTACSGAYHACEWIAEIAERRAREPKKGRKRGRKTNKTAVDKESKGKNGKANS